MKTVSDELYAHLQEEVTTVCTVWRLTRKDGVVMGFTDHDRDINIGGILFKASTGFTPTAIDKSSDLSVDNMDVEGKFEDDRITEEDMWKGVYDYAKIDVAQINYANPPASFRPGDVLWHTTGYLGEVRTDGKRFKVEVRSLTQMMGQGHGDVTTRTCTANLGDSRCKYDLSKVTKEGTVTRVVRDRTFMAPELTKEAGYYDGGKVTFLTGALAGYAGEVVSYDVGVVRLYLAPPRPIEPGARFTITPGCDKTIQQCQQRFDNVLNFRGFPHVPGTDSWQAGLRGDGIVNVMETLYDENERENGPSQHSENTTTYRTDPTPTGE